MSFMPRVRAKRRRQVWLAFVLVVLGPGAVATFVLKDAVWWVNFLSWLALAVAALTGWAAETPVEREDD